MSGLPLLRATPGPRRTAEGLLCVNDLPSPAARSTPLRKALIVAGVSSGLMSEAEACRRYALSPEELASWIARYDAAGRPGLRMTRRLAR